MPADLQTLERAFRLELEQDCTDIAVAEGLDELLRRQARGEPLRSPVLRMIANLPVEGYRSLDHDARRTWVRRAIATIDRAHQPGGDAPPPAKRPPARAAAKRGPAKQPPRASGTARRDATPRAAAPRDAPAPARRARAKPRAGGTGGSPGDKRADAEHTAAAATTPPTPAGVAGGIALPIAKAGTGLRAAALGKMEGIGIKTVRDALRYYPYRHNDFSQTVPISQLRIGLEQTVRGTIDRSREIRMGRGGRMRSTEVQLTDESGARIRVIWFNQPFLARQFHSGQELAVAGTVRAYRGRPTFENPDFERSDPDGAAGTHTGRMVPVYRSTGGLAQRTLRGTLAKLLERYADQLEDPLPEQIRRDHDLPGLAEATRQVHYPDDAEALDRARRRLAFDELLAVQLGVVTRKRAWEEQGAAPVIAGRETAEAFLGTLPYTLTGAQRRVLDEMLTDIARPVPMARLVEGDVGSGKTVVALAAMLAAVAAGYQATLMAPTEVLAEQHFRTVCGLLAGEEAPPLHGMVPLPFPPGSLRVALLTGSTKAKERRELVEAIRHGGAHIVIGTHALIQDGVDFQRLGLSIVDEQHRFGVRQRSALRTKGIEGESEVVPHLTVMTATPIPRSLALTLYGDLDLSVIDEMPPGRTPIETRWLPPEQRSIAFEAVREEIAAGRQTFVICPLVEGSDTVQSRAATEEYERLRTEEFPDLGARDRILLLHGRMSSRQKDEVMQRFAAGEADILVSTSVIEVGIDIPNATVMVIEGADRFGMAQLHQFRGRVGRGEHASMCFLMADDPSEEAIERLATVARTQDGFALAQADLELRGPGELFGTQQSGAASLRVASLLDGRLIEATRRVAESLLERDPDLVDPDNRRLRVYAATLASDVVAEMH